MKQYGFKLHLDKHKPGDKHVRHKSQDGAQQDAAHAHDREIRLHSCDVLSLCIIEHLPLHLLGSMFGTIVRSQRYHTRQEEQHADGDGDPSYCLFTILNEQNTYDDGASQERKSPVSVSTGNRKIPAGRNAKVSESLAICHRIDVCDARTLCTPRRKDGGSYPRSKRQVYAQ